MIANQSGAIIWENPSNAFGVGAPISATNFEFNLRFPGQYFDKESGLHYNYFRDYDPAVGRYIQSDPRGILLDFSDPQRQIAAQMGIPIPENGHVNGLNSLYGYAGQNPLIFNDTTGEVAFDLLTAGAFGLAGALSGGIGSAIVAECDSFDAFVDGFIFGAVSGVIASGGVTLTGKIAGSLLGSAIAGLANTGSALSGTGCECED